MLDEQVILMLRQLGCLDTSLLMQDGTTACTAMHSKIVIRVNFPDKRVISRTFHDAGQPYHSYHKIGILVTSSCGFSSDRMYLGFVNNEGEMKAIIATMFFSYHHKCCVPTLMTGWYASNRLLTETDKCNK
ncbi:hypothetical protein NPIL_630371 [Nephila pilipes]|uniref:Uncharacterized protein n=1 Tax=Nephila pilipes TaxID=299642 RepID=A0A8X6NCZ5_NEPPI|nr:hypothetical protein NPIL_645901 [Nephila pilipes]GFT64748.1 hypothetical protein NPIL_630371 [Nephila pilipes]